MRARTASAASTPRASAAAYELTQSELTVECAKYGVSVANAVFASQQRTALPLRLCDCSDMGDPISTHAAVTLATQERHVSRQPLRPGQQQGDNLLAARMQVAGASAALPAVA